ncbi:RNA recognition motif(a.k.aRRM RBD or RNP domain) [Lotmaria passim]
MEDRNAVASSVFFTGVSLTIEPDRLRQHFESVGHVVSFVTYGPAPGKDFRYGIAGYMDPQTAEEAIRRLNGTTFGERAMRVTPARSTTLHAPVRAGPGGGGSGPAGRPPFRKREREGYVPDAQHQYQQYQQQPLSSSPHSTFYGRGRGRGAGGLSARAPMMARPPPAPPQPAVDKDGRELMQLPRGFMDPVLGRDSSLVLNSLRGMATEEAYAAVEQLRVLALERPDEAKLLLQNYPALKSAVVITLQHAGRLAHGPLPAEAYRAAKPVEKQAEKKTSEEQRSATSATASSGGGGGAGGSGGSVSHNTQSASTAASVGAPSTAASVGAPSTAPTPAPSAAPLKAVPVIPEAAPMTQQERDEVLELIQNMSEEDVDRVLTMSARDLALVPDVAQRKQLEILQRRLLEMSRDL